MDCKLPKRNYAAVLLSLVLSVTMLFGMPAESVNAACGFYDYPNTWTLTGDQQTDIVQIALTQVGYHELGDNHTKYAWWYYGNQDYNFAWCAIFLSWCADQAGVPSDILEKCAYVSGHNTSNMSHNGYGAPAYAFFSTSAMPGDLVYIDNNGDGVSDHVGMVFAADESYIYTVEGNAGDSVRCNVYLADGGYLSKGESDGGYVARTRILFYVRPDYGSSDPSATLQNTSYTSLPQFVSCSEQYKQINDSSITVRIGPGTGYASTGRSVSKGTIITVTETANGWGKFAMESSYGSVGWVKLSYFSKVGDSESTGGSTTNPSESTGIGMTGGDIYQTTTSLNVRKGPGTNYSVVTTLSSGTQMAVLEKQDGWAKITYNGEEAWVSVKYLEFVSEAIVTETTTTETTAATESAAEDTTAEVPDETETTESTTETNPSDVTTTEEATETTTESSTTATTETTTEPSTTVTTETTTEPSTTVTTETTTEPSTTVTTETTTEPSTTAVTTEPSTTVTTETTTTTTAAAADTSMYKVTASKLNVRSGPSTSYDKIAVVSNGDILPVYAIKDGWCKVLVDNKYGWVSAAYLEKVSTSTGSGTGSTSSGSGGTSSGSGSGSSTGSGSSSGSGSGSGSSSSGSASGTDTYKVTASLLNVRSGPSSSYSSIGSLKNGASVSVYEVKNGWGRIVYNGRTGWISLSYAVKTGTSAPTVSTTVQQTEKQTTTETTTVSTTETQKTTAVQTTTMQTTAVQTQYGPMVILSTPVKYVVKTTLNVRSGPNRSFTSLGYVYAGDTYQVYRIVDGCWGQIRYNGTEAWISLNYCEKR